MIRERIELDESELVEIDGKAAAMVAAMTLEEKAMLLSGRDEWTTKPLERLGLGAAWLSDGPHGLRRAPESHIPGYGDQLPATCFPTASCLAASWDAELLERVGAALGDEARSLGVNVLLGPGVNIKRHPLCGRNFEYLSEDPRLAGVLGAAYIEGVQGRGVGVSLKHFAVNNAETLRMQTSSEVDERTLREIYLAAFERCVKTADPWTVMACYNLVNGVLGTEHKELLTGILRREWGFKGVVVSDWFAVVDRVAALRAGLDLEMPGNGGVNDARIVEAARGGSLDESLVSEACLRVVKLVLKAKRLEKAAPRPALAAEEHHALARAVAAECATLLKNEGGLLPLRGPAIKKVAVIGEFAVKPRFQGNGSSEVKPTKVDAALDELRALAGGSIEFVYSPGYSLERDRDLSLADAAAQCAAGADAALVFAGLPLQYESEGIDRKHIDLPVSHNAVIEKVAAAQRNTAVILTNGSAVAMPWADLVPSILECWLPGQAGGGAVADLVLGRASPAGRLAETFPKALEDSPAFLSFAIEDRKIRYGEGVFVGYRWYDARKIEPLFPFGHGLSYTSFEYGELSCDGASLVASGKARVSLKVTNVGARAGKEVVQIYVRPLDPAVPRPVRELRGFAKVELEPGSSAQLGFELALADFSRYESSKSAWIADKGEYAIEAGASSRDIRLQAIVSLEASRLVGRDGACRPGLDEMSTVGEFLDEPGAAARTRAFFGDFLKPFLSPGSETARSDNLHGFIRDMPIIKTFALSRGAFSREAIRDLVRRIRDEEGS
jgi:beta-glucosidase